MRPTGIALMLLATASVVHCGSTTWPGGYSTWSPSGGSSSWPGGSSHWGGGGGGGGPAPAGATPATHSSWDGGSYNGDSSGGTSTWPGGSSSWGDQGRKLQEAAASARDYIRTAASHSRRLTGNWGDWSTDSKWDGGSYQGDENGGTTTWPGGSSSWGNGGRKLQSRDRGNSVSLGHRRDLKSKWATDDKWDGGSYQGDESGGTTTWQGGSSSWGDGGKRKLQEKK